MFKRIDFLWEFHSKGEFLRSDYDIFRLERRYFQFCHTFYSTQNDLQITLQIQLTAQFSHLR